MSKSLTFIVFNYLYKRKNPCQFVQSVVEIKHKKKTGFRVEVRLSVIVKKVLFHGLHGLHNLLTGLNGFQVLGDEFVVTFGQ